MTARAQQTLLRNKLTAFAFRTVWDRLHPKTRFVFCASTGRSGTAYLWKVLSTVPGCSAHAEPWPIMHDHVMRRRNRGQDSEAALTYWVQKSVSIRRLAGAAPWYAETNHVFIKGFADFAVEDLGRRMAIIHLRRDPIAVASSMLRLGYVPGAEPGNEWYLDFRGSSNLLQVADVLEDGGEFGQDFYRCLWYWYETEARIADLRSRTTNIRWERLDWTGSMQREAVYGVLQRLGMPPPQALPDGPVNTQTEGKVDLDLPEADRRAMRTELERHLEREFGFVTDFDPEGQDSVPV